MNKIVLSAALIFTFCLTAASQQLLKDINTANASSFPRTMQEGSNGRAYFIANDIYNNPILYNSDGTSAGTIKLTNPSNYSTGERFYGEEYAVLNNKVIFAGESLGSSVGVELMISDGTEAGTVLLKDIYVGGWSYPDDFHKVGNVVIFSAYTDTYGREYWVTDGTTAGTQLLKDIRPGASSITLRHQTVIGNKMYFYVDDGVNGFEPWVTDGTPSGTFLLKDINSGSNGSKSLYYSVPELFVESNSIVFFSASDQTNGRELWKTDGTTTGTALVKDIYPGTFGSLSDALTSFNNKLYFSASDNINGNELWESDGTTSGTKIVKDIALNNNSYPVELLVGGNNQLFFQASDGIKGRELWKSDGTAVGTVLVKDINLTSTGTANFTFPSQYDQDEFMPFKNGILFTANSGPEGFEMWYSDGTTTGTTLIKDFLTGPASSTYNFLTVFGNEAYFIVHDGTNAACWKTDGTFAGTMEVSGLSPALAISNIYPNKVIDNTLYLTAYHAVSGYELYKTDGTTIELVKDIEQGVSSYTSYDDFVQKDTVNNQLVFTFNDTKHGNELWVTDGTLQATNLLADITAYPNLELSPEYSGNYYAGHKHSASTSFGDMVSYKGHIYFTFTNRYGSNDSGVWRTDGTTTSLWLNIPNGVDAIFVFNDKLYIQDNNNLYESDGTNTILAVTLPSGYPSSSNASNTRIVFNNELYFPYTLSSSGNSELWKTDGTQSGTVVVKSNNPNDSFFAYNHRIVGNKLFMTEYSNTYGTELWVTDGTTAGTQLVKDIYPGSSSADLQFLTAYNGFLYFSADDGVNNDALWRSDGTTAGTTLFDVINPSGSFTSLSGLKVFNNKLYYDGYDGTGYKLFATDGTTINVVKNGINISSSGNMIEFAGKLYFTSDNNDGSAYKGYELWETDGTEIGTKLVKDINPGSSSSNPQNLYVFEDQLLFTADNGTDGRQLYILRNCADSLNIATTLAGTETLQAERVIVGETANTISSTSNITYDAGNYVLLKAGFSTENGAVFLAQIGGCSNASSSTATFTSSEAKPESKSSKPQFDAKTAQYLQDQREMPSVAQFLRHTTDPAIGEVWYRLQDKLRPAQYEVNKLRSEILRIDSEINSVKENPKVVNNIASLYTSKEQKVRELQEAEITLRANEWNLRLVRDEVSGEKLRYELRIRLDGKEHIAKIDLP